MEQIHALECVAQPPATDSNRKLSANSSGECTGQSWWMWLWRIGTKLQAKLSSFLPASR